MIGRTLSHFTITDKLGSGAMGDVYRARDNTLGREVALKVLPSDTATDPDRLERFRREARMVAALNHPNIVTLYSVEEAEGIHLLCMELVEGESLEGLIPPEGLPLGLLKDISVQLAEALAAAHQRGVVHRDLKPANVMVGKDGQVKVLDFGLARLAPFEPGGAQAKLASQFQTVEGMVIGTLPYMSPEQLRGKTADPRSDIFSFGVIMYEMSTGQHPFGGNAAAEWMSSILRDTPHPVGQKRPDLPADFIPVINRCLEKDPARRFTSGRELQDELVGASPATAPASQPARAAPAARVKSIAVLPLTNLSGPSEEYFADGMTDALITDLAKLGGFKVISRTSVMQYKGTVQPISDIARELGVDAVVEGTVMQAGEQVRITAQLVRGETDEHLWAERYDRKMEDVLALQDEVVRTIAQQVGIALKGEPAAMEVPRKIDPEVFRLDLRGRYALERRTEQSFRAAQRLFQQAIDRDPTYAPAHTGLAESFNMIANYGFLPPREIKPRSLAAVERALELDESSADAHRILAFVRWQFEFDWEAAISEYERALELDPNSALTTYWFGVYLGVIGFFKRSHKLLEHAAELDPLSLLIPAVQGWVRIFARRFEKAIPYCRRVLQVDPNYHLAHWWLGEALVELGNFDEGIAAMERALDLSGRTSRLLGYLGNAYGRAGHREEALQILTELESRERAEYLPPYFPALVHSDLGDFDRALDRLEQAYAEGDCMLRDLKADAQWDALKEEPRFQALMSRMAYPARHG